MGETFEKTIMEAMSFSTYLDVRELRDLYYGRLDLYVSFSDDGEYELSGYDSGELLRPYGILAHSIDTVVGRKATDHTLYGNVFRHRRGQGVVNIATYAQDDYKEDVDALKVLSYLDTDTVEYYVDYFDSLGRLRSYFERLWYVTKSIAENRLKGNADKLWRRILEDLGYSSFIDNTGKGIFGRKGSPSMILIKYSEREDLDIVPMQKYRLEQRKMVRDRINRKVKKMRTRRNRVSKRKTDWHRGVKRSFLREMHKTEICMYGNGSN